jgi:hypothetical protein
MIKSYGEFIAWFEAWAQAHPNIGTVLATGGLENGIEEAFKGNFTYPFVWMEDPVVTTEVIQNAQYADRIECGVLFMAAKDNRRPDAQKTALNQMWTLCCEFEKYLLASGMPASPSRKFMHVEKAIKKEIIPRTWANEQLGWRIEFIVTIAANTYLT